MGEKHLLVLPKGTFYDVRQLRKRDMPMLEKMHLWLPFSGRFFSPNQVQPSSKSVGGRHGAQF